MASVRLRQPGLADDADGVGDVLPHVLADAQRGDGEGDDHDVDARLPRRARDGDDRVLGLALRSLRSAKKPPVGRTERTK